MQQDYIYAFEDLNDTLSRVHMMTRVTGKENRQTVGVAVDDTEFLQKRMHRVPAHLADCVDLAVAVAIADRLSFRKADDRTCHIHVGLPVRHPEIWRSAQTTKHLQDILYLYTQDQWTFEFRSRSRYGRFSERTALLPFPPSGDAPLEVALWSGGLDSLAGLYQRLSSTSSMQYILFGTGMNTQFHKKQFDCAQLIAGPFPGRTTLVQAPYRLDGTKELNKDSLQRSRGFVFLLLGAVCTALEDQSMLSIYENGIGAINLPYSEAEVGLDHSLAVHPLSLLRMSAFVSHLFGTTFAFDNPFVFQTKAQMCEPLAASPVCRQLIESTSSCDRPHRENPLQCGKCSSCLLRRQALAAVGIEDPTAYITTTTSSHGRRIRPSYGDYYRAMLFQVHSLRACLETVDPWGCLSEQYLPLLEIVDEMEGWKGMSKMQLIERLLLLYTCYVGEWGRVHQQVGSELLKGNDPMLLARNQASKGD